MKKIFLPISIVTALIFTSCGSETTEKKSTDASETTTKAGEDICFYSFNEASGAQVKWTAFKTTEKNPVGGQFDQVNVTAGEKSTKITDVLQRIMFNIPTASTNTANKDRDSKIINSFFGAMNATDLIIGHVKSAEGDNNSGTCVFYLTLNNVEKEVVLNYSLNDASLSLTGEIDLVDFGAESAVASLNEVCKELHKGPDGISKTWSVVEIAIETTLNKDCH